MVWTAFEEYIRMFGVFPSQFSLFIPDAQIFNLCKKLRVMDQDNKLIAVASATNKIIVL